MSNSDELIFASLGERVLYFGATLSEARKRFLAILTDAPDGCKVVKANGNESVTFPNGGSVEFLTLRSLGSWRGQSADRVYVPANILSELMEEVAPIVAASKTAAVVGYF